MARAKKEGNYRYLNVRIPEEILRKLDEYANTSRLPKNVITEFALAEYLSKKLSVEGCTDNDL